MDDANNGKLKQFKAMITGQEAKANGNDYKSKAAESIKRINSKQLSNDQLSLSMKLYDLEVGCLSELENQEVKMFSEFCSTIRGFTTPQRIKDTDFACKTEKNFDAISDALISYLKELGYETDNDSVSHYKLSYKARIHGVWRKTRFKLVWVDPGHKLHT